MHRDAAGWRQGQLPTWSCSFPFLVPVFLSLLAPPGKMDVSCHSGAGIWPWSWHLAQTRSGTAQYSLEDQQMLCQLQCTCLRPPPRQSARTCIWGRIKRVCSHLGSRVPGQAVFLLQLSRDVLSCPCCLWDPACVLHISLHIGRGCCTAAQQAGCYTEQQRATGMHRGEATSHFTILPAG